MKRFFGIILAGLFLGASALSAGTSHDHTHEQIEGPKGGYLLEHTEPQAEFFVEKDRTATITFYDHKMQPVPVATQTIAVIAEKDGAKTKLDFEKKGDVLVSKGQLPEGTPNLVVQFKQNTDAKPKNFRFLLNEEICGECNRAEYACTCAH